MAGNVESLMTQVIKFGEDAIKTARQFPYVSFVVRDKAVVSRAINEVYHKLDPTAHCDVVAIRRAQLSLETGDLSDCSLYSLFEPTVLSFDIAIWARIKHFIWSVDKEELPEHYTSIPYGPREYLSDHPRSISVTRGVLRDEGLQVMKKALKMNLSLVAAPYSRQIEQDRGDE